MGEFQKMGEFYLGGGELTSERQIASLYGHSMNARAGG